MNQLKLSTPEVEELISLIRFHKENLCEGDEREEVTNSLLEKLTNL